MCIIMDVREGNFKEKNFIFTRKKIDHAVVTAETLSYRFLMPAGASNKLIFDGEFARS